MQVVIWGMAEQQTKGERESHVPTLVLSVVPQFVKMDN
jgi:hypothetical protein